MADVTNPQNRPIVTRKEAKAAGAKRFWTGEPCSAGHIAERFVGNRKCRACNTASLAAMRAPRSIIIAARLAVSRAPLLNAKAAGETHFFTGKPCKRGHLGPRLVNGGGCIACQTIRHAAHRDASTLAAGPGVTQYISEKPCKRGHVGPRSVRGGGCVACDTERWAAKRAAEPEAVAAKMARYYAANSKEIRDRTSAWAVANPEQLRATQLARHALHPEIRKAGKAKRRARVLNAEGKHTAKDIKALFKLQHGKCAHPWCAKSLTAAYHADHIMPLALGGSNDKRNLQLLCVPCNMKKGPKHPIDFAQRHGLLL